MAVCITVDVDGEAGLPDGGRGYEHRLSSRSERSYGLLRGLPRVLGVLGEFGVLATFYVPGSHGGAVTRTSSWERVRRATRSLTTVTLTGAPTRSIRRSSAPSWRRGWRR